MAYECILVDEPAEAVRRITLNRPEKRNAISSQMRVRALRRAARSTTKTATCGSRSCAARGRASRRATTSDRRLWDDKPFWSLGRRRQVVAPRERGLVRVVGSREAGDRAGARLRARRRHRADGRVRPGLRRRPTRRSAIRGARIISPPDMQFHPWLVGMRNAMELLLTGDSIAGDEAARIGLCNRAVSARRARGQCSPWPRRSPRCRPICSSSTSAPCIGRWTSWECAPRSAPVPSCRRSPRTRRRSRNGSRNALVEHEGRGRQTRRVDQARLAARSGPRSSG